MIARALPLLRDGADPFPNRRLATIIASSARVLVCRCRPWNEKARLITNGQGLPFKVRLPVESRSVHGPRFQ